MKNKEIDEYIKQLEQELKEYELLIKIQNEREYRSKFLKEFQEEHGKNVFPDYDEIYKRYDKLKEENKQLENNRDKAVREIINMIENGNIEFFKGKKLENILMGDNK